ncbi:PKD domain-containing protein [Algoriphagus jejuensis]|uniref:PKD domain-containing protein n=1 Tax=Algoriphagus jejuensis TaxID=419934 RepID=UPI0031E308E4
MNRFHCVVLLLFFALLTTRSVGQVGFPYCESFQSDNTTANTVSGGGISLVRGAALQLTHSQNDLKGYIYIDFPFSSLYGIKVEFEYMMYGGTGGDGLTVFLFDADVSNFAPGGFGGSLGYAQRNGQPGLTGAYLGLGFDAFGNFSNTAEGKVGGFLGGSSALFPNSITLRKGGSGVSGYDYVIGRMTQNPPAGAEDLALDVQYRFPLSSGGPGTQRVTDPNAVGYRKVFLELEPHPTGVGYLVKLEMEVTTEAGKPRLVTIFPGNAFPYPAPQNLKIGFAASTGGSTNFHEIRNLIVQVSADEALQTPESIDISDLTSCAGQENQFYIPEEGILLPNENSVMRCLQLYASAEEIEAGEGDVCQQARCLEQNRVLVLPEGTFTAGDEPDNFAFFPNEDYIGEEVTIYYTLTDSYGKTSSGNSITIKIEESPEPIRLLVAGQSEPVDKMEICAGESVDLEGIGNEVYERYEWYKDGELLAGSVEATYTASEEGVYEILGYNRKNCPVTSNQVKIELPDLPEIEIESPIVGCVPGQTLDITAEITGYDTARYDYQLTGMGRTFTNDELKSVGQSGEYEFRVKRKSLDCYSEAMLIEVFVQEAELTIDFDFGVKGSGVKDETGGGVFPDDEIQFKDLSDKSAVEWEWNFGGGGTSQAKNPTHVFGKKGDFEVELIITDQYGCQERLVKSVSVTRSYRLMVPTGFTPGKEQNATFLPKHKGLVQFELLIFNMWGELIFRSEDLQTIGWDGTLEGKLQDAGVYVYRVNGLATDGEKVKDSGKFRLIR